jgi:hypothetical protein
MNQHDIEKTLLVQDHQRKKVSEKLMELDQQLDRVSKTEDENRQNLNELDEKLDQFFKEIGVDRDKLNLDTIESEIKIEEDELAQIEKKLYQFKPIETIEYTTWEEYKEKVNLYIDKYNIDVTVDPIQQILTPQQFVQISRKYREQFEKDRWDKWDYIFVGSAGILATITDYFWVATPKTSSITERLHRLKPTWQKEKERDPRAKVPYDEKGKGGRYHRINTPGHDPVLGFIFGVIDIMRGDFTKIKNGKITFKSNLSNLPNPVYNPIEAIIKQFLHLVSDVATPMGLPIPFASAFQLLNVGSRSKEKTATISQLSSWMYSQGYDLRHFVTMAITPATIEIFLRAYLMMRHYTEYGETKFSLTSSPKYRSMFLAAHAIACAGNMGKIIYKKGNPLAINYAEWLALFRYLLPSIKYWLTDKHKHIEKLYEESWSELLQDSQNMYESISKRDLQIIRLS